LLHAKNKAAREPFLNRDPRRVYPLVSDPDSTKRIWQAVMEGTRTHGRLTTQLRYDRARRDTPLNGLREKPIIETTAADLLAAHCALQALA